MGINVAALILNIFKITHFNLSAYSLTYYLFMQSVSEFSWRIWLSVFAHKITSLLHLSGTATARSVLFGCGVKPHEFMSDRKKKTIILLEPPTAFASLEVSGFLHSCSQLLLSDMPCAGKHLIWQCTLTGDSFNPYLFF